MAIKWWTQASALKINMLGKSMRQINSGSLCECFYTKHHDHGTEGLFFHFYKCQSLA